MTQSYKKESETLFVISGGFFTLFFPDNCKLRKHLKTCHSQGNETERQMRERKKREAEREKKIEKRWR